MAQLVTTAEKEDRKMRRHKCEAGSDAASQQLLTCRTSLAAEYRCKRPFTISEDQLADKEASQTDWRCGALFNFWPL